MSGMGWAMERADTALDVVDLICDSLQPGAPLTAAVARLYLINDILHNSSAPIPNASLYRAGFQVPTSYFNLLMHLQWIHSHQSILSLKPIPIQYF